MWVCVDISLYLSSHVYIGVCVCIAAGVWVGMCLRTYIGGGCTCRCVYLHSHVNGGVSVFCPHVQVDLCVLICMFIYVYLCDFTSLRVFGSVHARL